MKESDVGMFSPSSASLPIDASLPSTLAQRVRTALRASSPTGAKV